MCMFLCVHMYMCERLCILKFTDVYVHMCFVCLCVHIYMCSCMCLYACMCIHVYLSVWMYRCMWMLYVFMYVCAYICVFGGGNFTFFSTSQWWTSLSLHLIPQQLGLITKKQGPWGRDRVMCIFWGQRTALVPQLRLSLWRTVDYMAGTREMYVLRVQEAAGARLRVLVRPGSSEDSLSGLQMASPCVLTRTNAVKDHGTFYRVSSLVL